MAGVCRATADPIGRRDGRFSYLREDRRPAGRHLDRRHDGRLGTYLA